MLKTTISELRLGLSIRETFRLLTKRHGPSEAEEFARLFALRADEVMLDNTFLFDSVKPSIERLLDSGKRLAIVTSKFRYRIEAFLKREGLTSAFGVVVGAEDVSELKPSPAGLLLALEGLGSLNHQTVYVGDSVVDAEAAARAGVPFIAVLSGVTPADAFRRYKTHSIIRDLDGLSEALEKAES